MDRVFQKPYQPFHIMADCPRGSTSYGTGVEFESTSDAGNHFGTLQFFEVGVHPLFLLGAVRPTINASGAKASILAMIASFSSLQNSLQ